MRNQHNKDSLVKLVKNLKPYYLPIILSSICILIGVVLSIMAPQWLSKLTNTITDGAASFSIDMKQIAKLGIILACFYVGNAIFTYLSGFLMTGVTQKYSRDLRHNISYQRYH